MYYEIYDNSIIQNYSIYMEGNFPEISEVRLRTVAFYLSPFTIHSHQVHIFRDLHAKPKCKVLLFIFRTVSWGTDVFKTWVFGSIQMACMKIICMIHCPLKFILGHFRVIKSVEWVWLSVSHRDSCLLALKDIKFDY